jgi:hypothetical protein
LAQIATPTSKNDSLNGLPSFSLNFFPVLCMVCSVVRVRVCSVCLCMACVHGMWRVCRVCIAWRVCMCVVCGCAWVCAWRVCLCMVCACVTVCMSAGVPVWCA